MNDPLPRTARALQIAAGLGQRRHASSARDGAARGAARVCFPSCSPAPTRGLPTRSRRADATMLAPALGPLARVYGLGARGGGADDDEPDAPTPTPDAPTPAPAPNG